VSKPKQSILASYRIHPTVQYIIYPYSQGMTLNQQDRLCDKYCIIYHKYSFPGVL